MRLDLFFYWLRFSASGVCSKPRGKKRPEQWRISANIMSKERKPPREYNDHSSCPVQREEASYTQSGPSVDNSAHHGATTRESAAAAQRTWTTLLKNQRKWGKQLIESRIFFS